MKYEQTKHKIKEIFTRTNNNERDISRLTKYNIDFDSKSYFKVPYKYDTDWLKIDSLAFYDDDITRMIEIKFNDFPDYLIPFINVVAVLKTEDGFIEAINKDEEEGGDPFDDLEWKFIRYFVKIGNNYVLRIHIGAYLELEVNDNDVVLPLWVKIKILISNERQFHEIRTNKT